MTGAEIVPLVGGDQAIGIAVSSIGRGVVIRTCDRSIHQPRPNSNPSLWTFKPQSRKRDCVQSSALRIAGELVSRAPIMSERYCDGKSVVSGTSVSVRVALGGSSYIKKKIKT